MHNYKDLILWQKAINLVTAVYLITDSFPIKEKNNLSNQINRAAVSIPSNIAEGAGRNSDKEFIRFLAIAHASTYELETQLIISNNLGYLLKEELDVVLFKLNEIQKINFVFQQKLRSRVSR